MSDHAGFLPGRAMIGMVHLAPLPGGPFARLSQREVISRAVTDARILADAGFDAVLIENFGDSPFAATRVAPHVVAAMTVVARGVRDAVGLPMGINVLRNDALSALAVATACGASFIRVNVHVGVYATDQGLIEGRAHETIHDRQRWGSEVAIFADVHVKHAQPLSSPDIAQAAEETAYRGRADALIVSGRGTGKPTQVDDLRKVRAAVPDRLILVGSGVDADTVAMWLDLADGVIIGTAIKEGGRTSAPVDASRARAFVQAARS